MYSEPYPGLYQPSFGGDVPVGKSYTTLEPRVTVTDADGSATRIAYEDLLPPTDVVPQTVFRHAFLHSREADDPGTARWLRGRLVALAPGSDPRTLTIEWLDVVRRVDSSRSRVADVESVDEIDVAAS